MYFLARHSYISFNFEWFFFLVYMCTDVGRWLLTMQVFVKVLGSASKATRVLAKLNPLASMKHPCCVLAVKLVIHSWCRLPEANLPLYIWLRSFTRCLQSVTDWIVSIVLLRQARCHLSNSLLTLLMTCLLYLCTEIHIFLSSTTNKHGESTAQGMSCSTAFIFKLYWYPKQKQ